MKTNKLIKSIAFSLLLVGCSNNAQSENENILQAKKDNNGYSTEYFQVVSINEQYANSVSLAENTNAPYGYILDNKYKMNDIVKVTYRNDDIKKETLINGEELKEVKEELKNNQ